MTWRGSQKGFERIERIIVTIATINDNVGNFSPLTENYIAKRIPSDPRYINHFAQPTEICFQSPTGL